tara:strand:- start:92 stop:490 length:399 start_codon:yes stop_codon:yes gene_type:complete
MKFSDLELPSNKKFGFFFTFLLFIVSGYFFVNGNVNFTYIFAIISIAFLITTLINAEFLLPINKLWMRLGFLLGILVSPFILGLIFFIMFTPIAFFMRFYGRDELSLKFRVKKTYWILQDTPLENNSFKKQF